LVLTLLGQVAHVHRDSQSAVRFWGAVEALAEAGGPPLPADARESYEQDRAAASASLGAQAFAAALEQGREAPLEEIVRAALTARYPAPIRPGARGGSARLDPAGPLTRREREVAVLLARGLTDRQIASELIITEGTVGVHVEHILAKLSFRSRAQVAAWAAERGLLQSHPG
jgi:DNA-binding NarL/FixJ family response regulator